MSSSLEAPLKATTSMVRFLYGNPPVQRLYCDDSSEQTGPEGIYSPTPTLEHENIQVSGLLKENTPNLTLPVDSFTSWLAQERPHPRVFCFIFDRTLAIEYPAGEGPLKTIFVGEVSSATNGPDGKKGFVRINLTNWKSDLDVKVGIVEVHTCHWSWGSAACTIDKTLWRVTAVINTVDGKRLMVSNTNITSKTNRHWRGGWVEVGGAHIRTKDWIESNPSVFHMQREVPTNWEGVSADFYPGDDKTETTCTVKFSNDMFMGAGFGIPPYQPVVQTPRTG